SVPFTAPNNVHNTNLDLTNKITDISGGNYEKTVAVGEPVTTVTDNPATPDVTTSRHSRKKLQNKRLTANEESVECAPRLRRKALNQTLFNKSNQAIRVGACEYGLIVTN
ncbi:hypothetical protein V0R58_26545, partial [Pseudomonas inefficax]|nr:hypothetical protein [Pseudomonas inefficax]